MSGYRISQGAVLHALLARRQTYGYLPRRRTLSPALAGSNVSFVYSEQTDRQTDRQTDSGEHSTPPHVTEVIKCTLVLRKLNLVVR